MMQPREYKTMRRLVIYAWATLTLLLWPMAVFAIEPERIDPRFDGYGRSPLILDEGGGAVLSWLLLFLLTILCLAGLFKHARRTHLD